MMAYYRRYIPAINLSLEKDSNNVPNDGKYHILHDGKVVAGFKNHKQADEYFEQLVKASGYKPPKATIDKHNSAQESIERYLDAKAVFYAVGPIRKKGGRGGRGGV